MVSFQTLTWVTCPSARVRFWRGRRRGWRGRRCRWKWKWHFQRVVRGTGMSVFNVNIFYPPLALCWGRWSWSGAFFEQDGNSVSINSFCGKCTHYLSWCGHGLSTHKLSWWTWQLICAVPCDLFKSSRIYGCLTTIISEVFVDIIFIPNLLKGVRGSLWK